MINIKRISKEIISLKRGKMDPTITTNNKTDKRIAIFLGDFTNVLSSFVSIYQYLILCHTIMEHIL